MAGIEDGNDLAAPGQDRGEGRAHLVVEDRVLDHARLPVPALHVDRQQDLVVAAALVAAEVGGLRPVAGEIEDGGVAGAGGFGQVGQRGKDRRARRRPSAPVPSSTSRTTSTAPRAAKARAMRATSLGGPFRSAST